MSRSWAFFARCALSSCYRNVSLPSSVINSSTLVCYPFVSFGAMPNRRKEELAATAPQDCKSPPAARCVAEVSAARVTTSKFNEHSNLRKFIMKKIITTHPGSDFVALLHEWLRDEGYWQEVERVWHPGAKVILCPILHKHVHDMSTDLTTWICYVGLDAAPLTGNRNVRKTGRSAQHERMVQKRFDNTDRFLNMELVRLVCQGPWPKNPKGVSARSAMLLQIFDKITRSLQGSAQEADAHEDVVFIFSQFYEGLTWHGLV